VRPGEREQSEPRVHALLADANDPLLED